MIKTFYNIGISILVLFLLFSCEKEDIIIPINSVTISPTSITLNVGNIDTLVANISPINATNQNVIWSSGNTNFVSINKNGVITGIAPGIDSIKVTTEDGNQTATCIVTVIAPVLDIQLSKAILSINVGDKETLNCTIIPSNASDMSYSWSSNNTDIATISSNGEITGIKTGSATITATTNDGNKSASCEIIVTSWTTYKRIDGLASDSVWAIAIDNLGSIWFGCHNYWGGGGVSEFNGSKWTVYNSKNSGLIDNMVNTISIDAQNNKWIGCGVSTSGASKFDGTNWTSYSTSNSGLVSNIIITTAVDAQNNIWFGTFSGASMFDGTNWVSYNVSNSGLFYDMIYAMTIDNQDNKWFAGNGVSKFVGTNWTTYLAGKWFHSVAVDAQGNKWFGTEEGVLKFDGTNWTSYNNGNSGLINNQVFSIAIDKQGNIWFGTSGGMSKFDGNNWISYTTTNSDLTNNNVHCIGIDLSGNKWFGTYGGVSKLEDQ